MDRARCKNRECCKWLSAEDDIWQVRVIHADGQVLYSPCCSEECARTVQAKYAAIHKGRYEDMMNQSFQHMTLRDFGSWP